MFQPVQAIPSWDTLARKQVTALLEKNGLQLDRHLSYTCGLFDQEDRLLATGSCFGPTLRCLAVDPEFQGQGLLNQVMTHLMDYQANLGHYHLFLCTKPSSARFFLDLGFYPIAQGGSSLVFLENRRAGFDRFCDNLAASRRAGSAAAVVMHANPFTLGHQHLVEEAASQFDTVHLFVLEEELGPIPFSVRYQLVRQGVEHLPNVICHGSGPYLISTATFPGYFLPDEDQVLLAQAALDLQIFLKIAAVLGISCRFVGEEPSSRVTALYNQEMARLLPEAGIECRILPRLAQGGAVISASTVRQHLHDGQLEKALAFLPEAGRRYFQSPQAQPVLEAIQAQTDVIHY